VVVEFSSPNTNKPLHLGHIRNNLLGEAVSSILKANGKEVVKVNLVNDRGIHICKSMLAYRNWGNGETPASSGLKGDHLAGKYYVLFDKKYREEIAALTASGIKAEEAEKQAPLIKEAQQMLVSWENGDPEVIGLWKTMNGWVYEGFEKTYDTLGVSFNKTYYESETYSLGKKIVLKGLEEEHLVKKEDGSIWADLRAEGLDEKVLMRSDGTSVYMTQDLGTAVLRFNEFDPSRMIYVVGNEQNYHFDVLKLVLKKLGYDWAGSLFHLSYGMVELPQGKMKSREGTVVDADDLLQEMFSTAEKTTRELGKADELKEVEAKELFRIVGLGALKYFILKVDPKKNMLFDPVESIDFNGNTGPFIQYTHARIRSLLKKASDAGFSPDPAGLTLIGSMELLPVETEIIKILYQFPETIRAAGAELSPAIIANYSYDLAKTFNQFYQEVPVLKEGNKDKVNLRLALSGLTSDVIRRSMKLLGIEVPERM
jgi:arginyl-tRNA synthetase